MQPCDIFSYIFHLFDNKCAMLWLRNGRKNVNFAVKCDNTPKSMEITYEEFLRRALDALSYVPNEQQSAVLGALAKFCLRPYYEAELYSSDRVFVLNGYAGTGKTSLIGAIVASMRSLGIHVMLMAPTGRAAKVFGAYAKTRANTIHRKIYRHALGVGVPGMQENCEKNAVFIVDEASMINTEADGWGRSLLTDLIHYVYSGEGCSLILVGDTAQLPPVGQDISPAMDVEVLKGYGLKVTRATLTAVARQGRMSGILANATWQRRAMRQEPMPQPQIFTAGYDDVRITVPEDLLEVLSSAYGSEEGVESTILVTRSNRRATDFNRAIRGEVLYYEEEIVPSDLLMVAKNNYFWQKGVKGLDFVANGDIVRVEHVYGTETKYGCRFADVQVCLCDSTGPDGEPIVFDTKIILDALGTDSPALGAPRMQALYEAIMTEEAAGGEISKRLMNEILRSSRYWNALQVKYAYAVTCHKAQGGQWKNVIVDMLSIPPDAIGLEFYRWLYTATTRATSRLYFLTGQDE